MLRGSTGSHSVTIPAGGRPPRGPAKPVYFSTALPIHLIRTGSLIVLMVPRSWFYPHGYAAASGNDRGNGDQRIIGRRTR